MTVGAQLRYARSERKLTLSEVTKGTKIQPWVLEALEADRLQEMMSPIYVKGFLATYAKFLHLDADALIARLAWPKPEPAQETASQAATPAPVEFQLPLPLLRRMGIAVALTAAIALVITLHPLRWLPHLALSKSRGPKLASVSVVSELTKPLSLPTLSVLATQPLELSMTAHQTTWVQVRADGKLLIQQRLQRGANERWSAKKQFQVVVSKPSQVDLTLNGQPITPFVLTNHGRLLITHRGVTQLPDDE